MPGRWGGRETKVKTGHDVKPTHNGQKTGGRWPAVISRSESSDRLLSLVVLKAQAADGVAIISSETHSGAAFRA